MRPTSSVWWSAWWRRSAFDSTAPPPRGSTSRRRIAAPRRDTTPGARWSVRDDSTVSCAPGAALGLRPRRRRSVSRTAGGGGLEPADLGWHELREDHALQRACRCCGSLRADRDDRGDRRAATCTRARCAARGSPPNAEGVGGVSIRRLVRAALRMRPDRIIVGEVRGVEALDMIQALNTGHDGSLSTVHAGSPGDALTRLEALALMTDAGLPLPSIRAQLASSLDAVVQVARVGGTRRIESVAEVRREGTRLSAVPLFDRGATDSVESDVLRRVAAPTRPSRRATRSGSGHPGHGAEAA
ncbi:MAG: CpaF/VirB11 family protein [Acidimicrobiia bacterium]|nr:CpaF/VirB11 family protein [Acidimicrobiia bacterium]